mmetsp:Transcript_26982/g.59000  ORF Transcript_26982/g.59000 Transcript_26982/m.59000 type:complete len:234 (-) Transcript_26982:395-1096(-)
MALSPLATIPKSSAVLVTWFSAVAALPVCPGPSSTRAPPCFSKNPSAKAWPLGVDRSKQNSTSLAYTALPTVSRDLTSAPTKRVAAARGELEDEGAELARAAAVDVATSAPPAMSSATVAGLSMKTGARALTLVPSAWPDGSRSTSVTRGWLGLPWVGSRATATWGDRLAPGGGFTVPTVSAPLTMWCSTTLDSWNPGSSRAVRKPTSTWDPCSRASCTANDTSSTGLLSAEG